MKVRDSLQIYTIYGFIAFASVFMGLLVFRSIMITFVLFHLVTCLGIPLFHGLWEQRLQENWRDLINQTGANGRSCLMEGLGSGLILMIGSLSGFYLMMQAGVSVRWIRSVLEEWGLTREWLWAFAVYMTVGNSFFEELLWRGFTLERLRRMHSVKTSIILSSLFYASYHMILGVALFGWRWAIIIASLVWMLGCYWAYLRMKYQSLIGAWMSHFLADAGIMIALIYWVY